MQIYIVKFLNTMIFNEIIWYTHLIYFSYFLNKQKSIYSLFCVIGYCFNEKKLDKKHRSQLLSSISSLLQFSNTRTLRH